MKIKTTLLVLATICQISAFAQINISGNLNWNEEVHEVSIADETVQIWKFDGGVISDLYDGLPYYLKRFDLPSNGRVEVEIINTEFEPFPMQASVADEHLSERLIFKTTIGRDRNDYYGKIAFVPIVKRNGQYQRLINFQFNIRFIPEPTITLRGPENTETSALADGDIYKLAISQTGIHKLTYSFLKDEMNIDIDNVDPKTIKIYGNEGGMLPSYSETERVDDLTENAIWIQGQDDGSFDSGDYIVFYAEGPNKWYYDSDDQIFNRKQNIYDTRNFVFLKISAGNGLRVQEESSLPSADYSTSQFDDYYRFEEETLNVYHEWSRTEGSGQQWFGDYFKVARSYDYENIFNIPNLVTSTPVKLNARMPLRTDVTSRFNLSINSQTFQSSYASAISILSGKNDNIIDYFKWATIEEEVTLTSGDIDITVEYPLPATSSPSEAWLDYIQINARRQLTMSGEQMHFRDIQSIGQSSTQFNLSGASSNLLIWDITEPLAVKRQQASLNGGTLEFNAATTELRQFIAFDPSQALLQPGFVDKIENQNIHSITDADLVILYPLAFEAQAQQLAQHRSAHNNYSVALIRIDQLYNEFSSGRQDPTAIRDFARMLYDRSDNFKYLLLFGDASFDFRNIYGLDYHYIPTFERDSANPLFNFPTDDYVGILYHEVTNDPLGGDLNVAVGRFPVASEEEAQQVVDKVIMYDEHPERMRDWRTRMVFLGDDEDTGTHFDDANIAADIVRNEFPSFNVDKLFVDAFPQVSTSAGERSPDVTSSLNKSIFKGVLAVTYLGHGGPKGWAQERILNISDILNWKNEEHYPLFITATCSFTAFDDPAFVSGGEETFLNPTGGAIALFTTTRAVYANANSTLTNETVRQLLTPDDDHNKTMGDIFISAKNAVASVTGLNSRKFALMGDPSQAVAVPQYDILTTKINGTDVSQTEPDTIKALEQVVIEGVVLDEEGNIFEAFNGTIYPTIYDKDQTYSTLQQDPGSPYREFQIQKNVLFKGRATVANGRFSFTCIIPKDINYEFGLGKISYYAADTDKMIDADGYSKDIVIGGISAEGFTDDQGPNVEVFMNTEDFVFGGITNSDPTLLVKLSDDNGINVVGNSIGHDLEGLIDDNTQNTLVLNDFYEAELDDYTKGMVKYPLSDLEEGRHTMRVKAWDVANNSAEGYTEFVVASDAGVALEHVFNYPNPFFDRTCFQFDHNMPGVEMDVLIRIYTVSGRLIKTIEQTMITDGAIRQDDCIEWDGTDDFGDRIGKGVYAYKVLTRVRNSGSDDLKGESAFEKLVILK
ncbi:MAG: hypothetical protein DWQ02_20680 [Bacteroidetes bacterium]|nr:MAG: hypothetical protein DWQ02_20680 [Bacteroidota bacterium]